MAQIFLIRVSYNCSCDVIIKQILIGFPMAAVVCTLNPVFSAMLDVTAIPPGASSWRCDAPARVTSVSRLPAYKDTQRLTVR